MHDSYICQQSNVYNRLLAAAANSFDFFPTEFQQTNPLMSRFQTSRKDFGASPYTFHPIRLIETGFLFISFLMIRVDSLVSVRSIAFVVNVFVVVSS